MSSQPQTRRGWSGSTKNTQETGAMLGGSFWKKGDELYCLFQRTFNTKYGEGHEFMLVKPQALTVKVDEFGKTYKPEEGPANAMAKSITRFAIPPLAGFDMAVQDLLTSGFDGFRFADRCIIRCVDIQKASEFGFSDMPMFEISVDPR